MFCGWGDVAKIKFVTMKPQKAHNGARPNQSQWSWLVTRRRCLDLVQRHRAAARTGGVVVRRKTATAKETRTIQNEHPDIMRVSAELPLPADWRGAVLRISWKGRG